MQWVKCSNVEGAEIYVNLETASTMRWSEKDKRTFIAFPGGEDNHVVVKERPEEVLKRAERPN